VVDLRYSSHNRLRKIKNSYICVRVVPWIHFSFPLVVDTCVLQPPIATLGETASTLQVLPKGPVVRACWGGGGVINLLARKGGTLRAMESKL
jgi:hypothetical protein